MLRLILLLIVLYFVLKVVRRLFSVGPKENRRAVPDDPHKSLSQPEVLVCCPVCGTFFQSSRGVQTGDRVLCSPKCAKEFS